MNGTLEGDLGLQNFHQASSTLHVHQGFSQQDPTHYSDTRSPSLSLHPLQSLPIPTASLGQYVVSSMHQPQPDMGFIAKMNADVSEHILAVHSSSSLPAIPPAIPPLASHPPPISTNSSSPAAATSPITAPMNAGEGAVSTSSSSLFTQMSQLGPSERCTPSQAQSMGQQLLNIIAQSKRTKTPLPSELQNSFDVFHRCLAVVYGTFFLNLYSKANAPCLLCHGCKSLYPPGQFIHHVCPTLPPNILPCRSRMWRRCLVPLVSPGMDTIQQKQRWKYVLEKFSHTAAALAGRRNAIPPEIEAQLLEMPELKRGRFVESPSKQKQSQNSDGGRGNEEETGKTGYGVKTEDALERLEAERTDESMTMGTRFQGLVSMEGERLKEEGSTSPEGTQNLLDIEPPEYELEDGNSPSEGQRVASQAHHVDVVGQAGAAATTALGLAEQLIAQVRKLQQELSVYRAKLSTATEIIEKMPSEACMREQLAQALAAQQTLVVERDQTREQLKLSQERGNRLQRQLDNLRAAHGNMEKLFAM